MATNKNAFLRYQILDELLSSRYRDYSIAEMTEIICERMAEKNPDTNGVTKRCVEMDIKALETEDPFFAEMERYTVTAFSKEKQKSYKKRCIRYADPRFTIFNKEMSDDEKYLLREALSLLGQFKGLPNLDALERLRLCLGVRSKKEQIISFTKNPLENGTLLGQLFTAISQHQVVELHYHKFTLPDTELVVNLHPYLLKEYNRRWFLYAGAEDDEALLCFALDRINKVIPLKGHKYIPYPDDINEIFDDIIGVTFHKDAPLLNIYFWVSDSEKDYINTKPLHESQTPVHGAKEQELRATYPTLQGGVFRRITCRNNYELIRELCSYGKDLLVLEPSEIKDKVFQRISEMNSEYANINNLL